MKIGRKLKTAGIVAALAAGWVLLAPLLAGNLIVERPLARADAILVLSGSSVYRERTRRAAAAYRRGVAKKVLLTDDGGRAGWSAAERTNPPFVRLAERELIARGVPAENIEILQPTVDGTVREAELLREKALREGWRSVLVVTSAYHTRRALWTFERTLGADVRVGIGAVPPGDETPPPRTWWLSARGWETVALEYVKSIVYWVYY